jgi:outer membrane immunogenic protein
MSAWGRVIASAFCVSVCASQALAQSSWTGFYVGVQGGVLGANWDADLSTSSGAIHYVDPFANPNQSFKTSRSGTYGLTTGFNRQFGNFVAGLEADVSWTDASGSLQAVSVQKSQWDIDTELKTWGTVRARAGLLVTPSLLVYATGGFAGGRVDARQATTFLAPPPPIAGGRTSGSVDHIGYTLGGGAEWALMNNLTLKAEYLFVDLGKEGYALPGTTKPSGGAAYLETFATDLQFQVGRVGLNYRF